MTNDQQQVENEFHKFWDAQCDKGYKDAYEVARNAWFEAKRNQPVIELSYPDHGDGFRYWAENEVDDAITAAGYSYRVAK